MGREECPLTLRGEYMKSRNILILALLMALVTTFLFNNYLKELDKKYKDNQNKISVVVPKQDIKKNQKVTRDMLEFKELSEDSVHPEAIKNMDEIIGNYALTDMKAGEVLFSSRFTNQFKEDQLLTRKIREGYRAISIEVNFVESVSNMIQPEDYVDVIFSEKVKDASDKDIVNTDIILQNIRVLAVGKRLVEKESPQGEGNLEGTGENKVEYMSVTLELKPEDSIKIANSDERGNIKLILRSKVSS